MKTVSPCALDDSVALDSILTIEPLTMVLVKIGALVVDAVIMRIRPLSLLNGHLAEDVPDLDGVPRVVDVLEGPCA